MKEELRHHIMAYTPGLNIKTPEETRVHRMYKDLVEELNEQEGNDYDLYTYDLHEGLVNVLNPQGGGGRADPMEIVQTAANMGSHKEVAGQTIVCFTDYHVFIEEGGPQVALAVKRALRTAKAKGNQLVFTGVRTVIPPEIERELQVLEFELPCRDELELVVSGLCDDNGLTYPDDMISVVGALQGLTLAEAQDALAFSLVKHGRFVPKDIAYQKARQINKSGLMRVISTDGCLDDIGGLEQVKLDLQGSANAFDPDAKLFGSRPSKGFLAIGGPGTGKSLVSLVAGNVLGVPVLDVNFGSLMGGIVGESEGNWRAVEATAIAMAPCVLRIDEIDSGLGGSMDGPSTDSGTTDRLVQMVLTFLAENDSVFVVATANKPEKIMAKGGALIRPGRFDEVYFFDFPNRAEREAIFRIHIDKRSLSNPDCPIAPVESSKEFDLGRLADQSEGYSGAEIEGAIVSAWKRAWSTTKEVNQEDLEVALKRIVPVSKSNKAGNDAIRKWASYACINASFPDPDKKERKDRERTVSVEAIEEE